MLILSPDEPLAASVVEAIHAGDVEALSRMLANHPDLATARIVDKDCVDGVERTLLHVATDWPAHLPNVAATVRLLVDAGADVDARNRPQTETPLHWAASGDDIEALDALIDAGADIEAPGAVIAGGTPLDDAVAFGQWQAAHRLVARGAGTALWHAAALGLMDRVAEHFVSGGGTRPAAPHPWGAHSAMPPDDLTVALWCACHGGQHEAAEYLLERGAERNWVSVWDGLTPLDAARREGAEELVDWLRARGAKSADELS